IMQSGQSLRQSLIISRQATKACYPAETSFDHPAARQEDKASLRCWQFYDFELDAVLLSCLRGVFAGVALIDKGDLDRFAGLGLSSFRKLSDVGTVLFIGGCHAQSEQMPERIARQMALIAFPAFGPVVASASATLGRRLQSPAVKDCCCRAFFASLGDPQDGAQVVDE